MGSGSATPGRGQWCSGTAVRVPTVGARDWRMLYVRCILAVVCGIGVCAGMVIADVVSSGVRDRDAARVDAAGAAPLVLRVEWAEMMTSILGDWANAVGPRKPTVRSTWRRTQPANPLQHHNPATNWD